MNLKKAQILCLLFFSVLFGMSGILRAETLTVCSSGCDYTTIQAAHDAANPDDIIDVQDSILTEYGITISKNLTIQGQGQSNTIVQAAVTPETAPDRVFFINTGATVTIQNVTIRHGYTVGAPAQGGGIYNEGDTNVQNVTVTLNTTDADDQSSGEEYSEGGGVYNAGTMSISNSIISYNSAISGCSQFKESQGGGIWNSGTLTVINTNIDANTATFDPGCSYLDYSLSSAGGGIYNIGSATIILSKIKYSTFGEENSMISPLYSSGGANR